MQTIAPLFRVSTEHTHQKITVNVRCKIAFSRPEDICNPRAPTMFHAKRCFNTIDEPPLRAKIICCITAAVPRSLNAGCRGCIALLNATNQHVIAAAYAGAAQGGISVVPSRYPQVYRDNVTDTFFGTVVADPYRWLENTDSNETLACKCFSACVNAHAAMPAAIAAIDAGSTATAQPPSVCFRAHECTLPASWHTRLLDARAHH